MKEQFASQFAERFDELGLRILEPIDLAELPDHDTVPVTLTHAQGESRYLVGYADPLTLSSNDWVKPHFLATDRLLLLGPRVTERSAELFRQMGINYIDQSGNASIGFDGVHIDIRGRRTAGPTGASGPRMTRGGVNLFSAKRSQVIFGILSWPELLAAPIRELASAAGVSLGQTQETLELLAQYGFLDEDRRLVPHLQNRLIDQWTAAFPTGLGSIAKTGRYSGDWRGVHPSEESVYISGEAAVPDLIRAETAVLYTTKFPTEMIRAHRWRRNDEQPSILLRHRFWRPPHELARPGVHDAPWLLVYADLLASNDGRQREAAERLRERQR